MAQIGAFPAPRASKQSFAIALDGGPAFSWSWSFSSSSPFLSGLSFVSVNALASPSLLVIISSDAVRVCDNGSGGGGGGGGDVLSQSRKIAAAKQEFLERQEMARRNAAKVNADLDRPPPARQADDDEDRVAAVRAQRARDKEQDRKAHEAQLAAARKQAAEERALALRRPRAISPGAPAPKSLESTIVLSHGKGAAARVAEAVAVAAVVDDVSRIKGQKLSAKEQQRLEHERELAEARRLAFVERQALKAKIDAELSRDVAVA
eukprot:m.101311 g.101311  ORF g.101311 m.101311 type:complete len:264 (+) comp14088_c1_seq2:838-1629(+)